MTGRNDLLQSMRGIAAMVVLFGHAAFLMPAELNPLRNGEAMFFQASSAVIFFFVLSGLVLGDSLRRFSSDGAPFWLVRYIIARMARLLPVFWAATLLGAIIFMIIKHDLPTHMGQWFYWCAGGAWNWSGLISALVHLRADFDGALWSVRVEFWMIALLPLLFFVSQRVPLWANLAIICIGVGIGRAMIWPALNGSEFAFVCYAYCFYLGLTLPMIIRATGNAGRLLFSGPVATLAFLNQLYLQWWVSSGQMDWGTALVADGMLSGVIVGWGYVAGPSPGKTLLTCRVLVWLGDISYSFYAYGTPILVLVAALALPWLPEWLRTTPNGIAAITLLTPLVALTLILPLSHLSYRFIELRGIKIGGLIAGVLQRHAQARRFSGYGPAAILLDPAATDPVRAPIG